MKTGAGIFSRMRNQVLRLLHLTVMIFSFENISAQISIQVGSTASENFTIGTSATATVPTDWRVDKINSARTVGTYGAAVGATEQRAGDNMSAGATQGIYNYAAGDPTTSTERAIGFLSSGTGTSSGNLYSYFINTGACGITNFDISYNVEKYRMGSNASGYTIQMYYSLDGSTWTSAGASFTTSFAADGSNNGYVSAPGSNTPVFGTVTLTVASGGSLYLAWNYSVTSGTTYTNAQGLGIDDFTITNIQSGGAQTTWHFRSVQSGNWNANSTWESSADGMTCWGSATATPANTANTVTIRSPHTVNITAITTADQVVVDAGATLNYSGGTLTIANGTGIDLTVNGTFIDASTTITWSGSPTWILGANATMLRTGGGASDPWRLNYSGGMSTIPATANWILRKTGTAIPVLTTVNGSYYPNLTIENTTAAPWITTVGATFMGNTNYPRILGHLDIGGTGTGIVDFQNICTNATLIPVNGNLIVRNNSVLRIDGTGFDLKGQLIVDGTINYGTANNRTIQFSGPNTQSISGSGILNIYKLTINKSANHVTLNRIVAVDNNLTLTLQNIISSSTNFLILNTATTITGVSNSSFVSGPVRRLGEAAVTFPIGKNSNYRQAGILAGGTAASAFWNETFGAGCTQGMSLNGYIGSNGTWTVTNTGTNGATANQFFLSATEAGTGVANCGDGCLSNGSLTNRTIHIGNVSASTAGWLFCPTGDCGAAYDASTNAEATDKRAESPTINLTGKKDIVLTFSYLLSGQTVGTDYATVVINTGSGWKHLSHIPKSTTCTSGQGRWATYSVLLPPSANNNSTVKIGFRWVNNGDGSGSDPSFAVDDVTLTEPNSFTAEYFSVNPQSVYGNVLDVTLDHITACEYWIIDRTGGTLNKNVTLSWDATSCEVTLLSDLRVARYNTTLWANEGNTATTGTVAAGTVTSAAVNSFSPFTLSSVSTANPLPIELVNFNASYNGTDVDVTWTTASEINNNYFTVLRSNDGFLFYDLQNVNGAGNSSTLNYYSAKDKEPLNGSSYYQLKQTDFDGTASFSPVVPVSISHDGLSILFVNANADGNISAGISGNASGKITFEILDATGRIVYRDIFSGLKENTVTIRAFLSEGIYMLRISDRQKSVCRKFAY
ncbi:MAG TPA: hypothetical protein VI757_02650 [Bacteroidia bacterium]|nr:hypothetical protein [Bacteroidia bacterium]